MDFADCLSAFEDFLRTKETFRCSSEEMDSFLQTLSITEETRDLVKKAIMGNPPPTLKVHKQTVSLSSCYIDSIKQMQDVLQKDRTGKLGHIMQEIQKSLGLPQRNMFWEITTILEFSGEDRVSVRICEQKQRVCEAKVKMHQYFLLEGLQDVVACLSEIGNSSLEDVWKSCKSSSAPLAMQKVGMNQSKFEKTLESFPEAFQVEDGKVFLKDNPQITYSLILCHMQSAQHKLKDHLYNKGALLKNELFHLTPQLLSRAEILAMGEGMETFSFALQSLRDDFLLIPPHMLVVAQGTSQVQDNPFVSAVSKIKDFIRGENAGNGTLMSQLLRVVNKTLGPCEQAAVGNTSQKLRETIAAYPGHFIIGHGTVFVVSDDAVLLDVMNIKMQNLPITKIDQEISSSECSSDQYTESFEDSANSYPLDQETGSSQTDNDVCSSVQYTEQSECSANSDPPNRDEGSHCTDNDVCSSIQNTEHPEGSTNSGYLDHDTGSLHTENEAQSSIQNTELPEELANSDTPYRDTGSSHTDNDVCSTVQNTKCLEDSVHSDTSDQDTRSPCTDDDVCSSVQNTEHDEDLSNSVTPDQDTGSTCIDDDDVCSSIQNTGDPEDLANSDPLDQGTGSSHTDNDVCSSVQNTEHSEDFTNSDPSIQGTASPDGVCSSVQKTEHDEDLSSSVTPDQDTGSTCNDDDGRCSSVQNTEHGEDFAISDPSHHNTASPHADDNASTGSSIQKSEHDEDLANSVTPDQDTGSPSTDDGVCSSVQNTEHDEDLSNSVTPDQDTGSTCIDDDDVCSSIQITGDPEDLANSDPLDQGTGSSHTDNDVCSSVQNTEHSEDFTNSDPSIQGTASPDGVCSSVQKTEHDEDLSSSDPSHHNTASPHADDNACTGSSIQNSEHDEDLANSVTPDQDTRSPCTDDDVCSSLQNNEHDEDLSNYDTADQDTDSPSTDDDVCSSVQNTEHDEDFANSDPSHHDTVSADADVCSSIQDTEHDEDFPNSDAPADTTSPDTDNDVHACSSDQTPSLGQDEVESLGSEIISDSESLHSGTSSEAGNLDPDTVLSESTDQEIVTILQDLNYFGKLIKEFLSKATYPILSVSLSDGWLIASLWDGPTFATCLTPSSCDQQQILGPSERIALDFLTSKSILKVVFDWKHCFEISDALGMQMVKVFDLMVAERLIRPGSKFSQALPESLNFFGIDPCHTVEVCIGTIQAPVYGEVYSKEAILKLKETARWTMKQVPYLYQKMLRLMKPYQITKVSKLYDDEVEDQPFPSSQNEEPSCSAITSSITSSVTSSASPNASKNSAPVVSSSEMGSQVHVPVTSSTKVKATSEMPVSFQRVSSTSGDLDEPDSKGLAQSSDDLFYTEENLQSDLLSGPEVDSNFLIRDDRSRTTSGSSRSRTTSPSSRSRTTSRRSKKMQTTKKQEESSRQVTEGSGSTPSPMAYEDGTSEQLSCMVNAKVLHYDDAGKPILITCANELANEAINPCQISHELSKEFGEIVMHDQEKFLEAFGICIKYNLKKLSETDKSLALDQLTEVVMDLGRKPSARYYQPGHPGQLKIKTIGENKLTKQDLKDILEGHCSPVSSDHRSTIKETLHRVGIMCNRQNEPIGLTTLTKHAVLGCATPLFDLMNQGQSILFVGSPGVGKSTILREAARVINDVVMRRVVIVDTCNEIAGDGDVPHPAVGGARRVQLPDRDSQPNMIREIVRNHSPHTLVIDEVVTEADAAAVHATRERGIQVISAAPGQTLQDVILNPKLRHLFGGIHNMAMSHPGQGITGHTIMQRTQPAAFDILVEMYDRHRWIVHTDFTRSIDLCLQKVQVGVQERRVFLKEVSKDSQGIPQVLVRDLFVMYPL
eukprot:XP_011670172.1 PREDICTED: uncharacterized protein LOC579939 [Strongylocentrotus purpuratus]